MKPLEKCNPKAGTASLGGSGFYIVEVESMQRQGVGTLQAVKAVEEELLAFVSMLKGYVRIIRLYIKIFNKIDRLIVFEVIDPIILQNRVPYT